MDLSKELDCLTHSLLIAKLHTYGFSTSACELMAILSDANSRLRWATVAAHGLIYIKVSHKVPYSDQFYSTFH